MTRLPFLLFLLFPIFDARAQFLQKPLSGKRKTDSIKMGEYGNYLSQLSPCQKLKVLSNEDSIVKLEKGYHFGDVIWNLIESSNIPSYYPENYDFSYVSYSMDKSLYKVNIMQWMRYFGCNDTARLRQTTKGFFCEEEIQKIKGLQQLHIPIDTNIILPNRSSHFVQSNRKISRPYSCIQKSTVKRFNGLTECQILQRICNMDTVVWKELYSHLYFLRDKSGIKLDFDVKDMIYGYSSHNLNKSLFKLNLVQWASYFNCPCKPYLIERTTGVFNDSELLYIKQKALQFVYIDTSILYQQPTSPQTHLP